MIEIPNILQPSDIGTIVTIRPASDKNVIGTPVSITGQLASYSYTFSTGWRLKCAFAGDPEVYEVRIDGAEVDVDAGQQTRRA